MTNRWDPEQPSKTTFLDDEDTLPPPPPVEPRNESAAEPLKGGMPKGGVFHA